MFLYYITEPPVRLPHKFPAPCKASQGIQLWNSSLAVSLPPIDGKNPEQRRLSDRIIRDDVLHYVFCMFSLLYEK